MGLQEYLAGDISNPVWKALWQEMLKELEAQEMSGENQITTSRRSIAICNSSMEKLRSSIREKSFVSNEEEILFFKEIKPRFSSKLIFYSELFNILTRKPIGDRETTKKYFQREIYRLRINCDKYISFYEYFRSGSAHLDEKYFLRESGHPFFTTFYAGFDFDRQFSTGFDHIVALFLSNDLLSDYITRLINDLDVGVPFSETNESSESLTWTAATIYLVELIYALHSFAPFNNSRVTPTRIMKCLCSAFNIKIDNLAKKFEEIRIRKKNRIVFLNLLINTLQRQMEQDDLNAL